MSLSPVLYSSVAHVITLEFEKLLPSTDYLHSRTSEFQKASCFVAKRSNICIHSKDKATCYLCIVESESTTGGCDEGAWMVSFSIERYVYSIFDSLNESSSLSVKASHSRMLPWSNQKANTVIEKKVPMWPKVSHWFKSWWNVTISE